MAGRICGLCSHAQRRKADRDIVTGIASNRRIAARYGVSEQAVRRHRVHIAVALIATQKGRELLDSENLVDEIQSLHVRSLDALEKAENSNDPRAVSGALREVRADIELVAKMTGKIRGDSVTVNNTVNNVTVNAQFQAMLPHEQLAYLDDARAALAAQIAGGTDDPRDS